MTKYAIKVRADGYWVGFLGSDGEWRPVDVEPYDTFIEALRFRDYIEGREAGDGPATCELGSGQNVGG